MTATVDQITSVKTQQQNAVDLLNRLAAMGVLAEGWEPTRVPRALIEVVAEILTLGQSTRDTATRGRYLDSATGVYLDLLGVGWYDEDRVPAETAELQLTISDPQSKGPLTIENRQIAFALGAPTQLDYIQIGGKVTVPKGGSAIAFFRAAAAGAVYNRFPGDTFVFTTTVPYAAISSPAIVGTGSIMTIAGRDIESDTSYRARLKSKWGVLGRGWGEDAIRFLVRESQPSVTKIGINDGLGGGRVRIYLANDAGPSSAAVCNSIFLALKDIGIKPVGTPPIEVVPAPVQLVPVTAVLYNSTNPSAVAEASARLGEFARARGLGEMLLYSRIYEELIDVASGTVGIDLVTPTADVTPTPFSLVQFAPVTLEAQPPPTP